MQNMWQKDIKVKRGEMNIPRLLRKALEERETEPMHGQVKLTNKGTKRIKEETTPYGPINLMPGMQRVMDMELKDQHRELEKVTDQRTKKEHGYKEEEDGTNKAKGATLIAERQDQARKKEENSIHCTVRGRRARGRREERRKSRTNLPTFLFVLTLLKYMLQRK